MKYALENDIINLSSLQDKVDMNKRKKYLEQHPYKIWEGKDNHWYTYLPQEDGSRLFRKRNSQKDIENCVASFYEDLEMKPCFREVFNQWIEEKEEYEEVGKNSLTRYRNDFNRFFQPDNPFCQVKLCDMTKSVLEKFIKSTIRENELTAKAYGMLRLILNGVFKYALREGYTEFSIKGFFDDFILPKNIFAKHIKNDTLEIFNDDEFKLLIQYFENNPNIYNLGLLLECLTGLRVGELSALMVEDNISNNVLFVRRTEHMYVNKDNVRITEVKNYPKTDAGVRKIIIPNRAQTAIRRILLINPNRTYMFMNDGKRITGKSFNYYLQKACNEIGIPPRSTHKIRKTYASRLLSAGVDDAVVMKQMGHSNIITTHSYYHYDITTDQERFEQINKIVV